MFTTLISARLLIFYATFTREMSRHVIQIAPVSPVLEVKVSIKQQLSKLFLTKTAIRNVTPCLGSVNIVLCWIRLEKRELNIALG